MTPQNVKLEIRSESSLIVSLSDIDIVCQYKKSENTRYTLAFCDSDAFKSNGGYRNEGKGFYFLINNNVIKVIGQIERPNDGKVADNGWFIINDWLFTENLESIAYGFDDNGNIVLQMKLNANLLINAISQSGNFALFQTANSANDDGNSLFFIDLRTQELLWNKRCDFAWPIEYSISENERKINLHYTDIGTVSLDWQGNIIDKEDYQFKYVSSLHGNRLVYESISLLSGNAPNLALINFLEKELNNNYASSNTKAIGYKFLGEYFEEKDIQKALTYFEKALENNPKIGLKRKLIHLKSKL